MNADESYSVTLRTVLGIDVEVRKAPDIVPVCMVMRPGAGIRAVLVPAWLPVADCLDQLAGIMTPDEMLLEAGELETAIVHVQAREMLGALSD